MIHSPVVGRSIFNLSYSTAKIQRGDVNLRYSLAARFTSPSYIVVALYLTFILFIKIAIIYFFVFDFFWGNGISILDLFFYLPHIKKLLDMRTKQYNRYHINMGKNGKPAVKTEKCLTIFSSLYLLYYPLFIYIRTISKILLQGGTTLCV